MKPAIISTVIVLNIITNSLVIAVMVRFPTLREDRTALFIFTLCIADLAGGCTAMPISAALCSRATPNVRLMTKYLPKIQMFCFWCFAFNSMHSVAWVALSKMVAVLKPFTHEQLLTRNRCYGIIAFNWVVGAALAAAKFTLDTKWNMAICTFRSPANNKYASQLIFSSYILSGIIPIVVLIIATGGMLVVVLRAHRQMNAQVQSIGGDGAGSGGGGGVVSAGMVTMKTIRSAKNILIICFVSIACYIPVFMFAVIRHTIDSQNVTAQFAFSVIWVFNCNSFMNSFLYIILHRSVRVTIASMFAEMKECMRRD